MGVALLIVNHLSHVATLLHEILPRHTTKPVELITEGLLLRPNRAFIIPSQPDLYVSDGEPRSTQRGELSSDIGENREAPIMPLARQPNSGRKPLSAVDGAERTSGRTTFWGTGHGQQTLTIKPCQDKSDYEGRG